MKLYNSFSRTKEDFESSINFSARSDKTIKIYVCGPTVYDYIHIGNTRPMCVFDVLRRYLKYLGYNVKYVQNFTDVDDKIINRAHKENTGFFDISEKFIKEYKIDAAGLNVMPADVHPKASETIQEMIDMINILIKNKHAYATESGDVYFDTLSFENYGKLSNQTLSDLQTGARIDPNEAKKNATDFALWKASKPDEPFWDSPWGLGRPGWHIECSAMSRKFLGDTIDIHCGGQDLMFPHHENEIAQSEGCTGVKFSYFWLHNGYININDTKMSKSLNNFFTAREISEKYGYEAIRYFMISGHYKSPLNYTERAMQQSISSIQRLYNFKENLNFAINNKISESGVNLLENINKYKQDFLTAMNDDLNTSDALAVIFSMIKEANIKLSDFDVKFSVKNLEKIANCFNEFTSILGILYKNENNIKNQEEIDILLKDRDLARINKKWEKSDEIRDKLYKLGVAVKDTPNGTNVFKF
ncbi:MAG: cysteine--tRNA ligase [Candidatus Improbicoccus devescovinae]|nr:MAG: cysteine--tRNA ligase [Candidatus Improbicoccus devescovinae]